MPKFEQILEIYKIDYLAYNFLKKEVSFGMIFYEQNSVAEKEIEYIIQIYEQEYTKVVDFFEEHANTELINIYIYNSCEQKEKLMGNDWIAQSLYNQREIHHIYTEDIKPIGAHELTHLISLDLGLSVPLFQEGTAEFLQGSDWFGKSHSETLKESLVVFTAEQFLTIDGWLVINDEQSIHAYCFVAEYIKDFLSKHSKEVFFRVYESLSRVKSKEENAEILVKLAQSMNTIISTVSPNPETSIQITFQPLEILTPEITSKAKKVYGVCFLGDKIVLIYNSKRNIWGFPGGGIEEGETVKDALQREMHEEAELNVLSSHFLGCSFMGETSDVFQLFFYVDSEKRAEFIGDPDESVTENVYVEPQLWNDYLKWGDVGKYLIEKSIEIHNGKK